MSDKVKLVSWNVNGIRACGKKGLAQFVQTEKPDILCLQEVKANLEQVEEDLRTLGYKYSYWSSAIRKGYSGVATFVHLEPKSIVKGIEIQEYEAEGRIVITEHKAFDLYNIYFPNGGSGDVRHQFKQKFLKDLNAHLKPKLQSGKPVIVVGDYNVAHKEMDVYDPIRLSKESGFLPEERQWFDEFLKLGFIDTFRAFHPEEKNRYSWWSYRELARPANRGWRIDYICISKNLEKNLKSADILDQIEGSDHCPVIAELEF
ncbi:MAG: exodeoxyribonuclease III [Pseudobdellovibrionaceae bacterium]